MGTKNNPGAFDCYTNADADEPMFILLGRDGMAPSLVESWAYAREIDGEDADKVEEARQCVDAMRQWLKKLGKDEKPNSSFGSHIWHARLRPVTGLSCDIFINTAENNMAHAVTEAEKIADDPDRSTLPTFVVAIEYVGVIAN